MTGFVNNPAFLYRKDMHQARCVLRFFSTASTNAGGCNNYAVVATERAAYVLAITFTKLVQKEKSQFFRFEFVFVRLTEEVSCL